MNYDAQCSEKVVRIVQSDSMPANNQNARHDNMTVLLGIKLKILRQDEVEICQASRIVVLEVVNSCCKNTIISRSSSGLHII